MNRTRVLLSAILLSSLLTTNPAWSCIAGFGYTGSTVAEIDYLAANVDVGLAYIVPASESDYIVDDAEYLVTKAGPVFVDLTGMIFNPNSATVPCAHYERGGASRTVTHTNLRGNYQARLDTFFSVNADLFRGARKVYGLGVNNEANNRCVAGWKLQTAASYVETKLAAVAQYSPVYTIVGYGLRNTPVIGGRGPVVSTGFPVTATGAIDKFPNVVDTIAYWIYDIFDPGNPSHPLNVNVESFTALNAKLNQALNPSQTTLTVIKAWCNSSDPVEAAWGITCPGQAVWKIGQAGTAWKNYLLSDPRNLFVIAFNWTSFGPADYGSKVLPPVWSHHSEIQQQVNCVVP